MGNGLTFVSYVLAAMASVCFISGLAVLSYDTTRKHGDV